MPKKIMGFVCGTLTIGLMGFFGKVICVHQKIVREVSKNLLWKATLILKPAKCDQRHKEIGDK